MKAAVSHGMIAGLYGLGLTLALLGCMDLMAYGLVAAGIMIIITVILTACACNKWMRVAAAAVIAVGIAVWLLLGGVDSLTEILRAVTLQFTGVPAALPMVARETAILLAFVVGLASFALTSRGIGSYPALAVLLLAIMTLWLVDQPMIMLYLIPTAAATIAQAILSNHEELPLRRALPLAAAVACISFLVLPTGGMSIGPLKDAADELRQKIYDYFFYTEPRNVFSLSSEGYYPQGQTQLGGKAEPTDHPVMIVSTPKRVYLRGSSKNEYTGRVWIDTIGGRRYLWVSPQWLSPRSDAFNMNLPSGMLGEGNSLMLYQQISVRMLDSSASSLFVPQRIRELNVGGDLVPYFNIAGEVFATRDLQAGDTYTVTAPLMVAGDAGLGTLVNACAVNGDSLYDEMREIYTTLPTHLQSQVFDIAIQASQSAETPYDKALAIQNFLSSNFRYTLDVAPQEENIDFVSNFLLNTKEGYCTYFASAMTVLCRMVGLPARYVEGYLAEPNEDGIAYVTGLQGHAWTEVYFEGFGWLTFDATPTQHNTVTPPEDLEDPSSEPTPTPNPQEEEPTPTPESDDTPPETDPETEDEPTPTPTMEPTDPPEENNIPTPDPTDEPNQEPPQEDDNPPNWSWLWWLLAAMIAAAVALRIVMTQPKQRAGRAKDEAARWTVWVQALHDALRIAKLPRAANESPMAYMKRVDNLHRFQTELMPIGECMALVFYGHLSPEPEETAMAAEAYAKVVSGLKWWQKAYLAVLRAFVPEKRRAFTKA